MVPERIATGVCEDEVEVAMRRWHIELAAAGVFAVLMVATAVEPQWFERLFGVEPDGGSGALEWSVVAVLGVFAVVLAAVGVRDRSRARATSLG
jgi:hypothetical protein